MSEPLNPWIDHFHRSVKATEASARTSARSAQETYVQALLAEPRSQDPKRLLLYEHQVYSQNGEDGIIAEIFRRVGTDKRNFVEIGVGNGLENNSVYLLSQGWTGWWADGDTHALNQLRDIFQRQLSDSRLHLLETLVTAEDVGFKLEKAGVVADIDFLSIDIDCNTYWIWKALGHLRPRVVVVEYNSTFPAAVDWKITYDASAVWDGSFWFGASLKAYELLGRELGYSLVGADITGTNAFFVRNDLVADLFRSPFDAETHYEPARYWLLRTSGHPRSAALFQMNSLVTARR